MLTKTELITVTHTLYTFEELNQDAQWRVMWANTDNFIYDDMGHILEYEVDFNFPNSTIEAEYDFSACQGSGLNLYGDIALNDLVYFAVGHFLDHDDADDIKIHFPANGRYTYELWTQRGYYDLVTEALEDYFTEYGPESDDAQTLADAITDKMGDLCAYLYHLGELQIEQYGTCEFNEDSLFSASGDWEGYCWDYLSSDGWQTVEEA